MATEINANNIQGDILGGGLPKKVETFIFFQIIDAKNFTSHLKDLVPLIKTVEQVLQDRDNIQKHKSEGKRGLLEVVGVNIALSYTGLCAIGISDEDMAGTSLSMDGGLFKNGAIKDAPSLNDPMEGDKLKWDPEFLEQIDGVVLVAGDSKKSTEKKVQEVTKIFGYGEPRSSVRIVRSIDGNVRPGDQAGYEHFGFRDGISNPSVVGLDTTVPGPPPLDAKFILTGYGNSAQPDWTADGSFLVFRYLHQRVPEFNTFLKTFALKKDPETGCDLSVQQGSELLAARLLGRWKSGAPVDISPFHDDPVLAKDPNRNNDFSYAGELRDNYKCPWAAHTRRANPRADLTRFGSLEKHRIMRRGIPFGPEVSVEEHTQGTTEFERGFLFVCYQYNISDGFRFIQNMWANNQNFPILTGEAPPTSVPGLDPIIGQGSSTVPRAMTGYDPTTANNPSNRPLSLPDFVVPRGAGYFFSPSIKTLCSITGLVNQ